MADTTVRIDVSQTGQAAKQMKDLTDATNAAARATKELTAEQVKLEARNRAVRQQNEMRIQSELDAMKGGRHVPGGPGGMLGMGGFGPAAIAAIATATIPAALRATTNVLNEYNDPTKNPLTRGERTAEAIPIIGGAVKAVREFMEAVSGTTAALQKLRYEAAETAIKQSISIRATGQVRQAWVGAQGPQHLARVDAESPYIAFGGAGIDRSTLQGERQFQRARVRAGLEMNLRQTEIEKIAAHRNVKDIEEQVRRMETDVTKADLVQKAGGMAPWMMKQMLGQDIFEIKGNTRPPRWQEMQTLLTPGGGKFEQESRMRGELQSQTDQLARHNQLIEMRKNLTDATVNAAQKESAHRQASLAIDKERLQYLQQQEQRILGAARGYGAMNAAERLAARQAAERLDKFGLGALSEQQRAILSRAGGGERLAKEYEASAERDKDFKGFRERIGAEGDLKTIRDKQLKLETDIVAKIQLDKTTLQADIADAVRNGFRDAAAQIREIANAEIAQQLKMKLIQNWFGGN